MAGGCALEVDGRALDEAGCGWTAGEWTRLGSIWLCGLVGSDWQGRVQGPGGTLLDGDGVPMVGTGDPGLNPSKLRGEGSKMIGA